jgi:hypothetical protein
MEYYIHDKKDKVIINLLYYKHPDTKSHIIFALW